MLYDKNIKEPTVYSGILYNIEKKSETEFPSKFEQIMTNLEYKVYHEQNKTRSRFTWQP